MTGSIKRTTANYNLRVPIFDAPGWGREIERDLDILDATIFAATGFTNIKGVWSNSTEYHVGEYLVDQENNSLWRCRIDHTSAATGSFQDDRTAHPTYWEVVNRIVNFRGEWDGDASYLTNDFLVDGYRYGVVTQNYNAGASYDDDVLAGNILTLIDLTDVMGDANQVVSDAQGYASAASDSADDAANAKIAAETAQGLAEAAKTNAETAQGLAEDARDLAEGYKDSVAQSASDASDAKDAAVIAQGLAESARDDAVQAKNDAQGAASDAEGYRDETEIARNAVIGIYNNFAGGTSGQVLVKASSADFDYGWQTLTGVGDMLASVYDPQSVGGDAFDMDNMQEGSTNLILTAAERAKIADVDSKVSKAGDTGLGGFAVSPKSLGSLSGSLTPTYVGGNYQTGVINGALTIYAPTAPGVYDLKIELLIGIGAGAVTLAGFSNTDFGEAFTTTVGDFFILQIEKGATQTIATVRKPT